MCLMYGMNIWWLIISISLHLFPAIPFTFCSCKWLNKLKVRGIRIVEKRCKQIEIINHQNAHTRHEAHSCIYTHRMTQMHYMWKTTLPQIKSGSKHTITTTTKCIHTENEKIMKLESNPNPNRIMIHPPRQATITIKITTKLNI